MQRYRLDREGDRVTASVVVGGGESSIILNGSGQGAVGALIDGVERHFHVGTLEIHHYDEMALTSGTQARAMAAIQVAGGATEKAASAVAFADDTTEAVLQAVLAGVAKLIEGADGSLLRGDMVKAEMS